MAKPKRNIEARHRMQLARYFQACLVELNVTPLQAAKAVYIEDSQRIKRLHKIAPQMELLQALGSFIERTQRSQLKVASKR
jgi:hypothetical protein